ncbi:MAG: hypothetical protein GXP62_10675, partial [Oligoflexia bacterium]|nr:hypothetical protein [Oligoflexia bacterium]
MPPAWLLLGLIAAALVGGLWLPDRTLAAGDMLIFFPTDYRAPWQGTINPAVMAGAPSLPNPETGAWYPPAWPLAVDWFKALPVYLWFHLWLGGLGVWAWTRRHTTAPAGPLVAAVAWMSCGPTWSLLTKVSVLPTHALLPWVLYGVDRTEDGHDAGGVTVIALSLASAWYGGAAEGIVLSAAVGCLWALHRRRSLALTVLGLGIGVGLCLALLVPLLTLLPTTTRAGGLGFDAATAMSTPLRDWFRVVVADPDWLHNFGDLGSRQHWLVSLYAGLVALGLGLLGLRHRKAWRAVLPIAIFLLLALGQHNPLYVWFQHLPLLGTIRYPEKWWLGAVPFGVFLVALGTPRAPRAGALLLVLVTLEGLFSTQRVYDLARISQSFASSPTIRAILADAGDQLPLRTWNESIHHQRGLPAVEGEPLHRTVHRLLYPNVGARFGLYELYGSWALRSAALDAWVQRALASDLRTRHAMLRGAGVAYWIVWDQVEAMRIAKKTGLRPVPAAPG